jgi:hypothetical protein
MLRARHCRIVRSRMAMTAFLTLPPATNGRA